MKRILPVIVVAQFLCTSPWFAVNAIMPELIKAFALDAGFLAHLASAIQLGFIAGTLVFATLAIADRFSPSLVFFGSSILSAVTNLLLVQNELQPGSLLIFRFLTGFFLAGIYPIGMKIASDHYRETLGRSLGWLVGALAIGTALPHLLKAISFDLPWKAIIISTSVFSLTGGLAICLLVPDGPYRTAQKQLTLAGFTSSFKHADFRAAAFGYFGHMWELYAFWVLVPVMLLHYKMCDAGVQLNVSLWSFLVIAGGGMACIISGILSGFFGVFKIATLALTLSCICCIISPLIIAGNSPILFLSFLIVWGFVVVADSPMFSTMVARTAPGNFRGTAFTVVNCLGFSITIVSIQLMNFLAGFINFRYLFLVLCVGPLIGIWALLANRQALLIYPVSKVAGLSNNSNHKV